MDRKTALFLAILTVVMLTGCNKQTEEATVETEQVTTVSEVTTTTETTAEVTTATEAETTTVETTTAIVEDKILPAVYSADEKYEFYPMEVIHPEKQETDITAETVEIREGLCNADGYQIVGFEANYPVFSSESVDSAVIDKTNSQIKSYIDEAYKNERTFAEEYTAYTENEFNEWPYTMCGIVKERQLKYDVGYSECVGYDVCGNILSVNFVDYHYGAGAAHGYPLPYPVMYDLRTGEQIKLSEMVENKDAFVEKIHAGITDTAFETLMSRIYSTYTMDGYREYVEEEMSSTSNSRSQVGYGIDENGEIIIGYCNADTRLTVKNGCVGFYLAPNEYGCFADGIRLAKVPVDELLPYMNDEGKALFEGVVSATAAPVMLTTIDGTEKIISREQAAEMAVCGGENASEGE